MVLINLFKPLSTFLKPVPLINLSKVGNFSSWIFLLGIELGVAGSRSKYANHCAMVSTNWTQILYVQSPLFCHSSHRLCPLPVKFFFTSSNAFERSVPDAKKTNDRGKWVTTRHQKIEHFFTFSSCQKVLIFFLLRILIFLSINYLMTDKDKLNQP